MINKYIAVFLKIGSTRVLLFIFFFEVILILRLSVKDTISNIMLDFRLFAVKIMKFSQTPFSKIQLYNYACK